MERRHHHTHDIQLPPRPTDALLTNKRPSSINDSILALIHAELQSESLCSDENFNRFLPLVVAVKPQREE